MRRPFSKQDLWILGGGVVLALGAIFQHVGCGVADEARSSTKKSSVEAPGQTGRSRTRVVVVKPSPGGIPRTTTQPATMESFDFADLYAKISGYVKVQPVDIGDAVKAGQVLVEIEAPEYEQAVKEAEAAVAQAEAQVAQMQARVTTARAEFEAATANIKLVEAELVKATSYLTFREIQYNRISDLFKKKAIEERLVDEKHEQRDAAQAAENSAIASIASAKAQAAAAKARIASAEADVVDARAKVRLAQAAVGKAQVFVDYSKIISPYNGVVTRRSFHVGDFIRAADQGGNTPLLTVARTDLMRVIVQVPERDVPYTDVGDPAILEITALSGEKLSGKVSRIANSEDRLTRTMRTEIDIENKDNRLRDGMFGRATIYVEKATKGFTVPSESLVGEGQGKKSAVFVARDGKAHRVPVEIGQDDGVRVEILSGLSPGDHVILRPPGELAEGAPVEAELSVEKTAEKRGGKDARALAKQAGRD